MACDGEIADEELTLLKHYATTSSFFETLDVEGKINEYVAEINLQGLDFLAGYLGDITDAALDEQQELNVARIAITMIEADNKIQYQEVSFFKRIRERLHVSDEMLLEIFKTETLFEKFPEVEPEDFLMPDIKVFDDLQWNVKLQTIKL